MAATLVAMAANVIATGKKIASIQEGWRLEQRDRGYYQWRWQLKTPDGKPVTYKTESGKVGYKRGCQYVRKGKTEEARETDRIRRLATA